jgi:hypothetical protein
MYPSPYWGQILATQLIMDDDGEVLDPEMLIDAEDEEEESPEEEW